MKRILVFMLLILLVSVFSNPASALLIRTPVDSTYVVVMTDGNNVQWADLKRFVEKTYSEVLTEIDNMNLASFAGATDWHLASETEVEALFAQIVTVGDARQFDPLFTDRGDGVRSRYELINLADPPTHAGGYWAYQSFLPDDSTDFMAKDVFASNFPDDFMEYDFGAFVVSSATASIPEPGITLLLVFALLGFLGFRRKFTK